jgi:hypothetical protein
MRTSDAWHNPSEVVRILTVGIVYGFVGAMAGGVVGALDGQFIATSVIGGLLGVWIGTRMERK